MHVGVNRKFGLVAAVAAAAVVGGVGGYAVAGPTPPGPDSNGVVHACVAGDGGIKIVNAGVTCDKDKAAVSWNQQGQMGATGATGPTGPQGPQGPAGQPGTNGTDGRDGVSGLQGEQIFTWRGYYVDDPVFVVPNGVTHLLVEEWGAGGGGACYGDARYGFPAAGGAGGAGGYTRYILSVVPGERLTVHVGTHGAACAVDGSTGDTVGSLATAGEATTLTISDGNYYAAGGGAAGEQPPACSASPCAGGAGGQGGEASSPDGIAARGRNGAAGAAYNGDLPPRTPVTPGWGGSLGYSWGSGGGTEGDGRDGALLIVW